MATGKRYFWIKLRETFMTSDTVDFLMSQKDGANYVVLYQMLCIKTINTGGRLSRQIGEYLIPYDVDKIQRDCKWFSADTIRVALNLYKRLGLIYEDVDGTLILAEHDNMVGSETDWGEQKRRQRAAQLPTVDNVHTDVHQIVHTDIRDKRLDIRDKRSDTETDIDNSNIPDNNTENVERNIAETDVSSSERSKKRSKPEPTPSEFNIILNDGTFYNVPVENVTYYKTLYPAVDVEQELRNMMGWSEGNPRQRKTRGGVKRFINGWLAREQDRGGTKGGKGNADYRGGSGESPRQLFSGETVV